MKRYLLMACLAAVTAVAGAQKVIGESVIKLTKFTQDGWDAYVTLKNTGDEEVTYVKYRIYYKDLKGNDIDYVDYVANRSIEPGLSRRFPIHGYGGLTEFVYNDAKKNFQFAFEVKEIRTISDETQRTKEVVAEQPATEVRAGREVLYEETARQNAAAAAAKKAAAEEEARRQKAAAAMNGIFGGTSGSGTNYGSGNSSYGRSYNVQGSACGNTTKGNPAGTGVGSGSSGSGRWSLAGRSLKGYLSEPSYNYNAEGIVVVRIRVNAAGQVVDATLGQGSTTSDQGLIQAAIAAAKKATFSAGDSDTIGSITYVFKMK